MKRNVANITSIICVLLVVSLAACSGGKSAPVGSTSPAPASSASQSASSAAGGGGESKPQEEAKSSGLPISDKPVELSMWKIWSNNFLSNMNDISTLHKMEEDTNVKINYVTVATTAAVEKFGMLLASGDYPDLIDHGSNTVKYPGGGDKAIADGIYVDMTPLVAEYMPNYADLRVSTPEIEKMTLTDEGKMWCINMLRAHTDGTLQAEPTWVGLAVRADWLDELGLEKPVTIDDWHAMLTAFKNEKNCEAPLMLGKRGFIRSGYFISAYGVLDEFFRDGGTVKYGPLEEGYRSYVELMRQWYAEGLVDQNFVSNDSEFLPLPEYNATGKTGASSTIWGFTQGYYRTTGQSTDPNLRFEAVQGPVLNKGEVCQSRYPAYVVTNQISLTTACKEPVIAAKWMDYQYTVPALITNYYGVEGDTYVLENGKPVYTEKIMTPGEGMAVGDMMAINMRGDGVGLNAWDRWNLTYDPVMVAAREVWFADGFDLVIPEVTMTEAEGLEYNNTYTDIKTFVQEKTVAYIMGTESMDSYDAFVEQVRKMNIDKCLEIQQAAMDRYNAR